MNLRSLQILAVALLMFTQMAQTLYSPALTDIGQAFGVSPARAAQTLSVYFLAFAAGVVLWGRLSDRNGRRPAMLGGLAVYVAASLLALMATTFNALLCAQALAAFGAAVGSVVTQTLLRDRFQGVELARVFSRVGMALSFSPAIGLFAGALLVGAYGYRGVLVGLLGLSLALLAWSACTLPETRVGSAPLIPLGATLGRMLRDLAIWRSALLVALFNVALLSYYSLAPFLFQRLGVAAEWFGYSGVVLALGSGLGAWLNSRLLRRGFQGPVLLRLAALLALGGGLGVQLLQHSLWLVVAMLPVVVAFGMAIPNILGAALKAYADRLGTAGALFGLMYYLMIGSGLWLAAWGQSLGLTLLVCGALTLLLSSFTLAVRGCRATA